MVLPTRIRRAWRELTGKRNAFAGAEVTRLLMDWVTSLRSADEELKQDLARLRARARDLARNDGYIRKYLILLATNVIGPTGFTLQAKVRDSSGELSAATNARIESAWKDWSHLRVTVDGRLSLIQLESLLLKTVARDGEAFVRLVEGFEGNAYGLGLQPIDPDLVDHTYNLSPGQGRNEVRMGVEVDAFSRPVGYWVSELQPSPLGMVPRRRYFVPAAEMLHLYAPERVNQTRGVTWLHSVTLPAKMLDGYEEAELVAARTAAAKMGWIQAKDSLLTELGGESKGPLQMDAAPGVIESLPAGWEFNGWNPDHPVAAFPFFVKSVLRKIATGLGCSYNALADDLENVNYSSMRSGLLIERDVWKSLQQWWIDVFRGPIYRTWLGTALLTGALRLDSRDPRRYLATEWTPRGWAWVDPLKDVQAAKEAIKNGLGSRRLFLAEQGLSFEDVLEQLAEEGALAKDSAVTLEEPMQATK